MADKFMGLSAAALAALRAKVRGTVISPRDQGYAMARRVWNAAIDRRPAGIVVCADAVDVSITVRIAADHGLPLTIRGGGHNVGGRSIREGVLLLDLSKLRDVTVNQERRIATGQGGALWRDVDVATAREGLATTGGLVSSTGVGGFTLGGGAGWLMRKHGLACDNVRSAGVVLADGRFVRASEEEHADLYWGLRGAGGGFGVVTNFEFQLHPLRDVLAGLIIHSADHALEALRAFRDFAVNAPPEFCGLAVAANAPPLPFLDAAWHGRAVVILAVCWSGAIPPVRPPLRRCAATADRSRITLEPCHTSAGSKCKTPAHRLGGATIGRQRIFRRWANRRSSSSPRPPKICRHLDRRFICNTWALQCPVSRSKRPRSRIGKPSSSSISLASPSRKRRWPVCAIGSARYTKKFRTTPRRGPW